MLNIAPFEAMAKLNLPEAERTWVIEAASVLEDSFKALSVADTGDAAPLVTVLDIQNVLREDIWSKSVTREELLETAPEQYDGYFQVPKTIE